MARYIREVELKQPEDFVQYIMTDFLSKHGFKLVEFEGQMVYRVGGGLAEIPKFLVWGYQNGIFHLEAWIRNCWLPGVYGGENAMTGFMGCIPKKAYKNDIEALIGLLFQPLPPNAGVQPGMSGTPTGQPGMQQPVYVRGTDTSKYATMSLVFSLIGLLGIFVPLVGIIFGAMGIAYAKKGQASEKRGLATAAFVIGIIAIVLAVFSWVAAIFLVLI